MRASSRRVLVATTALVALLAAPARAVLTGPEPIKDVPYGALEAENGTVFPAPAQGEETVAFVHGGWCSAQLGEGEELTNHVSPTIDRRPMLQLQRSLGSLVFDIDYPQMTRSRSAYPMEPRAIERAVVWLHEHAAEYGGDPDNIVMWGSSCGGWVAAEATGFLQEDHPGMLSAAIEWSAPWLDVPEFLSELIGGETAASGVGPTVEMLECHAFVSKSYADCEESKEIERSPIFHIGACVPWMISWGEKSDLVDKAQSEMYATALEAAGCDVTRSPATGGHALMYFQQKKRALFEFIAAH